MFLSKNFGLFFFQILVGGGRGSCERHTALAVPCTDLSLEDTRLEDGLAQVRVVSLRWSPGLW